MASREFPNAGASGARSSAHARSDTQGIAHVRLKAALFLLGAFAVGGALAWRLVDVQVLSHDKYSRIAGNIHTTSIKVAQQRGDIITADGKLLARSVARPSVFIDPSLLRNPADRQQVALEVAGALGLDPMALFGEISDKIERRFIWVKRQIDSDEQRRIQSLIDARRIGVGVIREYQRIYPCGTEAAHLAGITDIDGNGLAGVENAMNGVLDGEPVSVVMDVDGRRQTIASLAAMPADSGRHGRSVVLTINSVIQHFVEREADAIVDEWKPLGVVAIAMDVNTGAILGMTSRPTYNPNRPGISPPSHWNNAAISNAYEIGSVFKPIVMALAVEEGAVQADDRIYCHDGLYRSGRRTLRDVSSYGWLTAREVIWKSSNIGMAKVGEALGNERMHRGLATFGFGRPTGIELPNESPGRLFPIDQWTSYSTGSIPMGHEIMVTPIQVATAFAALANGGWLLQPRLVSRVFDADGRLVNDAEAPVRIRRVVSEEVSRQMVEEFLPGAVYHGTGRNAQLERYAIGGKTGTGRKVVNGRYSNTKHVSSFVAVGPVERPQVVVLVIVDEPSVGRSRYGGTVAAPGAARIMERTLEYLEVRPELTPDRLRLALRPDPAGG